MKILLHFIAMFTICSVQAQNLVPNPSFEINIGCPDQIGQVDKAVGWENWGGTPDYYHNCANFTTPNFGTPSNNRGFQVPHTGVAYIGLLTFADQISNWREFVGRELLQPMTPGQQYFISFWVCNIEEMLATHSSDRIGVRFTTAPHSLFDPDTALNNGHVFATSVISDSINWTLVNGVFVADSAYTHIGIGNYFDDANTAIIPGFPSSNYAYYLIDDVCVSIDPFACEPQTAIESLEETSELVIYPNPANDTFYFTGWECNTGSEITISDISGRTIIMDFNKKSETPSDISQLSPGSYFVTFRCESNYTTKRLLISE